MRGLIGSGMGYLNARKILGQWQIDEAVLEDAKTGERINIAD